MDWKSKRVEAFPIRAALSLHSAKNLLLRCGEHNLDFGSARSFAQVRILRLSRSLSELVGDDNADHCQQRRNQITGCPPCCVVRLQLPPGFGDSLAGSKGKQGTNNVQDDLHNSIAHSAIPFDLQGPPSSALSVKVVNGLASRLTQSADSFLYGSDSLVSNAFARKIVIAGDSPDAFLHAPDQIRCARAEALLRSPTPHLIRAIFHPVKSGLILQRWLIKQRIRKRGPDPDSCE